MSHYHVVNCKIAFIFSLDVDHATLSTQLNLSESTPKAVGLALGHLSKLVLALVTYSYSQSLSSLFAVIYGFASQHDFIFTVGSLNRRSCLPSSQTVPCRLKV